MSRLVIPTWQDLDSLVHGAQEQLLVVAPFYSEEGVEHIVDNVTDTVSVEVVTRLSPSDWAAGVADPESLKVLLDLLPGRHTLGILQHLHGKAYVTEDRGLVGSANLSAGGFARNVEFMVHFEGEEVKNVRAEVIAACDRRRSLSLDALSRWIDGAREAVEATRRHVTDEAVDLSSAQEALDKMLGFGGSVGTLPSPTEHHLESFVSWLCTHTTYPGANVILQRYLNTDGQNLTGHVKQCFCGVVRFLDAQPKSSAPIVAAGAILGETGLYQPSPTIESSWCDHLDDHALDTSQDGTWSYPILRGLLPPSLGGTRTGGGGASSTLKRMLLLVALSREGDMP